MANKWTKEAYRKERKKKMERLAAIVKENESILSVKDLFQNPEWEEIGLGEDATYEAVQHLQGLLEERRDKAKARPRLKEGERSQRKWGVGDRWRRKPRAGLSGEKPDPTLQRIVERYTPAELSAIAAGGRLVPGQTKVPVISFEGKKIRFALIADTHFGSIFMRRENWDLVTKEIKRERCEFVVHAGDITEGFLSRRTGHVYELSHIGYDLQKQESIERLSEINKPLYLLGGNHDEWVKQDAGADIAAAISEQIPRATYLGMTEGTFTLEGKVTVNVFHGGSVRTYAYSYPGQKKVESYAPGEKPNVLLCGHTHKSMYFPVRSIHVVSGGCIQLQSGYMKRFNIEAHTGFWIITATINKDGVADFDPKWKPFYA